MSHSSKTSGLLLFVFFAVLFFFLIFPIFRIGLGHFVGLPFGSGPFLFHGDILRGPALMLIPLLVITLFWLLISIWVYNDAERNGMSGLLWALLVFFGNIIALIIYLIVRSSATTANQNMMTRSKVCPTCKGPIQSDFTTCPNCGTSLKNSCPRCHKNVQGGWKHCAYCGEALNQ